jgi:hypothetical protein
MGTHAHGWWILLHIVLFVFWLGGDLGVFWSSRFVLKPDLSPQARLTALKIMSGLDLGPKICLVLFLPSGLTLMALEPHGAQVFGLNPFGWPVVVAVWLFAFGWLWATITDHHHPGQRPWVRKADWTIRISLITVLAGTALYTLIAPSPFGVDTNPKWLGAKILLYSIAIGCGLGIRLTLRSFGPAFAAMMAGSSTPEVERRLTRSIDGCLPYVWGIWGSVLAAAALGVLKPLAEL